MVEFIAAAAAGAHALFSYNRSNFFFDQEMRIKREYQGQDMRIKQFELYREDVRDLVGLTTSKMDNYLIVNTLQLGFCITLFCEGRLAPTTPDWLLWLYTMCLAGAFMYLLLSVWLSMHASIAAHSFGVRLLTQFVRLPVPTSIQLNAARAFATDFEGKNVKQLLRVPIWKEQAEKLKDAMTEETKEDEGEAHARLQYEQNAEKQQALMDAVALDALPVTVLEHIRLYRQLQANWQSYDAYSRVCMSMGTNQLLHALTYYCLGFLIIEDSAPVPAYACAVAFATTSWLLVKLDLYLNKKVLWGAGVLLITGFLLGCVGVTLKRHPDNSISNWHRMVIPWVFILHLGWIFFIVIAAKGDNTVDNVMLPTRFRAVLYLDVFGWCDHNNDAYYEAENNFIEGLTTSGPSPARARAMLCAKCRDLSAQCQVQLECWQKGSNLGHLEPEDAEALKKMQTTYDEFYLEMRMLVGALPTAHEVQEGVSMAAALETPSWLQLEWNKHSGYPMVYFCNVDTNSIVWPKGDERPKEVGLVAQPLGTLGSYVEEYMECVHSIKMCPLDMPSTPPASPQLPDTIRTTSGISALAHSSAVGTRPDTTLLQPTGRWSPTLRPSAVPNRDAMAASSSGSPRNSPNRVTPDVRLSPLPSQRYRPFADEDVDNPAQETRFGGREGASAQSHHFSHTADTGTTFHPEEVQTRDDRVRTPPGQIPWRTFYHASLTLIIIWACGTIWSIVTLGFDVSILPKEERILAASSATLVLNQTLHITPPHPFFRVDSLACDGADLYFGETFKIHHYKAGLMTEICQLQAPLVDLAVLDHTFVLLYEDSIALNCSGPVSGKHQRQLSSPLSVAATRHGIYVLAESHLFGFTKNLVPLFRSPSPMDYDKVAIHDNVLLGLRRNTVERAWNLERGVIEEGIWTHLAEGTKAFCVTHLDGADVVYVARSPYLVQQYLLLSLTE